MRKSLTILLVLARTLGVVQLLVGVSIWFSGAPSIVPMHIALGSIFVLVMWIAAGIALFVLPKRGVALFTMLLGGVVLWFGTAQVTMLPGSMHWAVRFVHLLLGLAALGLIESLAKAVRRHWATRGE
jgi:hypothetical protein